MRTTYFLLILGLVGVAISSELHCSRLKKYPSRNMVQYECWDGSEGSYGCCRTGDRCWKSIMGFGCHCDTECRGWSAAISTNADYNFRENYLEPDDNINFIYGADDRCHALSESALSARVAPGSCAKLWEKQGCKGNNVMLQNGTISDIRNQGLSGIRTVSGCKYVPQASKEVTIFQNNFLNWFGSTKKVQIVSGFCGNMDGWWKDRVSMIKSTSAGCYKIWQNQDCTGESHCICGKNDLELSKLTMEAPNSNWNNNVRALSLCNYPEQG